MSFGKELREQIHQQTKKPDARAAQEIAEVLGIVARAAIDGIIDDMRVMIKHSYWKQLDGYVLALSKVLAHDLAWDCTCKAFEQEKATPPPKYQTLLGRFQKNPIPKAEK